MSMTVKIKRVGNSHNKYYEYLNELTSSKVSVGHYASQGNHYSGYSFVDLLQLWANGVIDNRNGRGTVIRQDVRQQFILDYIDSGKWENSKPIRLAINRWLNAVEKGVANPTERLLDDIGKIIRQEYKSKFNNVKSPYMNATDTPLFDTGELSEKTAYKHNKDNKVKE